MLRRIRLEVARPRPREIEATLALPGPARGKDPRALAAVEHAVEALLGGAEGDRVRVLRRRA